MSRRRLTKEEREKEIIEAAKSVFIKKGYLGATTMELARRANISEVTLFRYFPSKNKLFMATIGPIMTKSIDQALREQHLPPDILLENFMRERIHFIISNRELIKLTLIESEMNHELSKEVNVIDSIINKLQVLLNQLEIPENKQRQLLQIIIGSFMSILFVPIDNQELVEAYIKDVTMWLKEYLRH